MLWKLCPHCKMHSEIYKRHDRLEILCKNCDCVRYDLKLAHCSNCSLKVVAVKGVQEVWMCTECEKPIREEKEKVVFPKQLTEAQLNECVSIACSLEDNEHYKLIAGAVLELQGLYEFRESVITDERHSIVRSYFVLRCSGIEILRKYLAPEFLKSLGEDLIRAAENEVPKKT